MKQEKLSIKKLFDFSPLALIKTIGLLIKVAVIVLLLSFIVKGGVGFYDMFFGKSEPNVTTITMGEGSTVIQNDEKLNEVGLIGGSVYYDEKVGGFLGVQFSRRF